MKPLEGIRLFFFRFVESITNKLVVGWLEVPVPCIMSTNQEDINT